VIAPIEAWGHRRWPYRRSICAVYVPEAHREENGSRMKIATFNVNGVNGRLPVLLRWLAEAEPDTGA
jgi:hypothetical protein